MLCAKNDVDDDFAERLGHVPMLIQLMPKVNRAFSAYRGDN
jgi:hypothetical protein